MSLHNELDPTRKLRSQDEPFHIPIGAQPINETIRLTLENVPEGQTPELLVQDMHHPKQVSWRIGMLPKGDIWMASFKMPAQPAVLQYYFSLGGTRLLEKRQIEGANTPVYHQWKQQPFQIAVYDPEKMPAQWTQGMLIYQIFPDRFHIAEPKSDFKPIGVYGQKPLFKSWDETPEMPPRGRDFYGGNLRGITEKLDYLADLGVECLYLNPIFQSPTNHRYDALDYLQIDPMLGTEADLVELCERAHERGIKIILDAVFNHCSCDSPYFDLPGLYGGGAAQTKESPYYRWFNFHVWSEKYQDWAGVSHMPEFVECPEVEDFFLGPEGVTRYWLNKGIDGWRTDVTSCNTDEFWRRFRKTIDGVRPDAYLVSEEWEEAPQYLVGDTFSATMNYRFCWSVQGYLIDDELSPTQMDDRLTVLRRDTPPPALLAQMNLVDSHDVRRLRTACDGNMEKYKQTLVFQLAYPGAPMIYYANETGIPEGEICEDGRRPFPWDEATEKNPIFAFYKKAIAFRQQSAILRYGIFERVVLDDENRVYVFVRRYEERSIYAAFNASDKAVTVEIPLAAHEGGDWEDVLNWCADVTAEEGKLRVKMPSRSAAWYIRI